jgi:hypothetical protein
MCACVWVWVCVWVGGCGCTCVRVWVWVWVGVRVRVGVWVWVGGWVGVRVRVWVWVGVWVGGCGWVWVGVGGCGWVWVGGYAGPHDVHLRQPHRPYVCMCVCAQGRRRHVRGHSPSQLGNDGASLRGRSETAAADASPSTHAARQTRGATTAAAPNQPVPQKLPPLPSALPPPAPSVCLCLCVAVCSPLCVPAYKGNPMSLCMHMYIHAGACVCSGLSRCPGVPMRVCVCG